MNIGIQTGGIVEKHGLDGAYRLIKESGFDAADANIDHLIAYKDIVAHQIPAAFLGSDRNCLPLFDPWRDAARKYGVDNYQAHAPFPSFVVSPDDEGYNDVLVDMLRKMIIGCDYIGCRNLVIHPFFRPYQYQVNREQEIEENLKRYTALMPTAKEYGVTICLENMFSSNKGRIYAACCSDIDEACVLVDELNKIAGQKVFGFCLDTGHLLLLGLDVYQAMVKLGSRISAFHIHDNDGRQDQHLAPYMGVLDWQRFVKGLKDIGYNKTLSFETFNVWNTVDPALCPEFMKFMATTARYFAQMAEER